MQEEESHLESKSSGNNGNPGKKDSHKSSNSNNSPSKPSTNSLSNNNSSSSSSSKPSKGSSKDKPKNSISDKLGKNGKLTGDECDHCIKKGLCLYCSEKGHAAMIVLSQQQPKLTLLRFQPLSQRLILQAQKNSPQPSGICYMV